MKRNHNCGCSRETGPSSVPPAIPSPNPTTKGDAAMKTLSVDWPPFAKTLASVLGNLEEDQFLIVSVKHSNRYVQFAAQGSFGMRAETTSNHYLPESEQLTQAQIADLVEAGWHPPTRPPAESTPEADPDGSPNFFIDFRKPGNFTKVSRKAVSTLAGILGVPHPGYLEYQLFDADGNTITVPELGLKRGETEPPTEHAPLPLRLLATVRELTGIPDLGFDDDGDIALNYGPVTAFVRLIDGPPRVAVFSPLLTEVEKTPALLARLNDLNSGRAHLHFYVRMNVVFAVTEIPAEPYVPDQVSIAVQDFCVTAEGAHEILRSEFGSPEYFAGAAPGTIRH
jgi:hypothetical protein